MTQHLTRPRRLLAALSILTIAGGLMAAAPTTATAAPTPSQVVVDTSARKAPFRVGLKVNRATVVAKKAVVLTGKVLPSTRTTRVVLQKRLAGGTWKEEARTGVRSGAYRFVDRPSTAGTRHYRVIVPASATRSRGTSKAVKVEVFRWLDLDDVDVRSSPGTRSVSSVMINSVRYKPAFTSYATYYDEGFVDWNFQRRCTTLKARYGASDDSDDGARASIEVVADGKTLFADTFGLTESRVKALNVRDVFRLAFTWTSSNPAGTPEDQSGAIATMAAPQVLCSF